MGWFGHGIYHGDETQTRQIDFIKWSRITKASEEEISTWMGIKKTKIPNELIPKFKKNINKIIKKMPCVSNISNCNYYDESSAIDWQMLLALFIDNNIKPNKLIYTNGIKATNYLMGSHAKDFNNPRQRKRNLKTFIMKAGVAYESWR